MSASNLSSASKQLVFAARPTGPRNASPRIGRIVCHASEKSSRSIRNPLPSVALAIALSLPANVSHLSSQVLLQSTTEVAEAHDFGPKVDSSEQRRQLGETVGDGSEVSAKANNEGDATGDSSNDSPRPRDRTQFKQPLADGLANAD